MLIIGSLVKVDRFPVSETTIDFCVKTFILTDFLAKFHNLVDSCPDIDTTTTKKRDPNENRSLMLVTLVENLL